MRFMLWGDDSFVVMKLQGHGMVSWKVRCIDRILYAFAALTFAGCWMEMSHIAGVSVIVVFVMLALGYPQCREKVGHAIRDAASCIESRKRRKQEIARKSAATTCTEKDGFLPALQTGEKTDNSLAKLILGSDFVDDTACDYNETDSLKSSIDHIVKHFSEAKCFPQKEHAEAGFDPALFMEPVLDMENAQVGWESSIMLKGRQEALESIEYFQGHCADITSACGLVCLNNSASVATKRAGDVVGSDDQDEQDFLAFIDQVLGPLPGDEAAIVALQ